MRRRKLGKSGLQVSAIGLGCKIAAQKQATPAQIAIAWLLAQKPWIVPIPGTTKLHRLEEKIRAAAVELTTNDISDIDSAVSRIRCKAPGTLSICSSLWAAKRKKSLPSRRAESTSHSGEKNGFPRRSP